MKSTGTHSRLNNGFPDLCRRGASLPLRPEDSLESKGSSRPWAIQSHYDHSGWYIIWRYLVDPTETIETGKAMLIWRVDVVFLEKSDWKYEGSKAGASGGGRDSYVRSQAAGRAIEKRRGLQESRHRYSWRQASADKRR